MATARWPWCLVWCLIFCVLCSSPSTLLAAVVRDGTVGPGPGVQPIGPDYLIPASHGAQSGGNLFHSFSSFSISPSESATFTPNGSSGPINNVIARVTGGNVSSIDGLLSSSQISGANFFLLNPAGVLFGPNASLDVGGSFHASTADYLKFDNLDIFNVNSPEPILSSAEPAAFGFLSAQPQPILGDNGYLSVPQGNDISLVGGDISYNGPGFVLDAPSGRINLISVASPGEVDLLAADLGMASFSQLGKVSLTDFAFINVEGNLYDFGDYALLLDPAGSVVIRGGEILLKESGLYARGNPGGYVDVAGGSLTMDDYAILLHTTDEFNHPGNAFNADLSGDFKMVNGSWIESNAEWTGNAGHIVINAKSITLGDDTPGTGPYAPYGYYGNIASSSFWEGRGGDLSFAAENITIQNGFYIVTTSLDFGNAGDILVRSEGSLSLLDQGNIASNAYGFGNGGTVDVHARDILVSATNMTAVTNSYQVTGIAAQTDALDPGVNGGRVVVKADESIILKDGGRIDSELRSAGTGADLEISAKNITVSGFVADYSGFPPYFLSSIDGRVIGEFAEGNGGNISISATDALVLANGGTIRTGLYGDAPGNAGSIEIQAGDVSITSLGQIYADSFRGSGNSGDITIDARSLSITGTGQAAPPEPLDFTFTGLSTTTNAGRGGTITAKVDGDLTLANAGGIRADTQGSGSGGAITLSSRNLLLSDGGSINSSSAGTGHAGDIAITAAETLQMRDAAITTEASVEADGGNINLSAQELLYLYNSEITSSVGGGPETTGGNITIDPEFVVLNHSRIVANAYAGTGGNISIVAGTFLADPLSLVDASSQLGVSGTVDIQAPINNISGLVSPLSSEFISASALLKERCIARLREGGKYSSFVVGGRDGLPIEPGNLLPGMIF